MSFERGFLAKPAVKALLDSWDDHARVDAQRRFDAEPIAARNEDLVSAHIRRWFAGTEQLAIVADGDELERAVELRLAVEDVRTDTMPTRYGIQHIHTKHWWAGGPRGTWWSRTAAPARWFPSWTAAELAALREITGPRSAWQVVPIPEQAYAEPCGEKGQRQ